MNPASHTGWYATSVAATNSTDGNTVPFAQRGESTAPASTDPLARAVLEFDRSAADFPL
jgi:hypothetical protein